MAMLDVIVIAILSLTTAHWLYLCGDVAFCEAFDGSWCEPGCQPLDRLLARVDRYELAATGIALMLLGAAAGLRLSSASWSPIRSQPLFYANLLALSATALGVAVIGPGLGIVQSLPWTERPPLHVCEIPPAMGFVTGPLDLSAILSIALGGLAILIRVGLAVDALRRERGHAAA